MSNHVHLLCKAIDGFVLSNIMLDFKKFTSKKIIQLIQEEPESRREWMLDYFKKACEHLKKEQQFKVYFVSSLFQARVAKWLSCRAYF
jgi:REP element-mobilizing transposase RayT